MFLRNFLLSRYKSQACWSAFKLLAALNQAIKTQSKQNVPHAQSLFFHKKFQGAIVACMLINKLLSTIALILLLALPETALSQVKGKIIITHLEAGGNAAAYGLTYLNGPSNRTQVFACPRSSSGLLPTGRTQCDTSYGSSSPAEWQPGDVLVAAAAPETSAEVPYELRTGDNYLCYVKFTGWGGACQGMGTLNTTRNVYECQFTLPSSGNVEVKASYSGTDYKGDPCIAITNPVPTATPGPTATPTPKPGDAPGTLVLSALTTAADEFAENLNLTDILRGTAKFIIPKNPDFTYEVSVSVKAVSEGASPSTLSESLNSRKKVALASIQSKPIIATGSRRSSLLKDRKLKLTTTEDGLKVVTGRKSLGVKITIKGKVIGDSVPKLILKKTIYK